MGKGRKKKRKEARKELECQPTEPAGRQSGQPDGGKVSPAAAGMPAIKSKTRRQSFLRNVGLCAATIIMLSASFAPFDLWLLAYFALVPWCLSLVGQSRGRAAITGLLTGLVFWAANNYWLMWVTLVGYSAMVVYLSFYWVAASMLVASAIRRKWPMWIVLPAMWVGLEFARSYVISGFPWFFLAHTQYAQTELIQITDVTGQYGVSFFVAMVNGFVVDLILAARRGQTVVPARPRWLAIGAAAVAVTLIGMITYGRFRLGQQTCSPGPVIGIVQQAVPISLSGRGEKPMTILKKHIDAAREFAGAGCDCVLTPETMAPSAINREFLADAERLGYASQCKDEFDAVRRIGDVSREIDCPILIGAITYYVNPQPEDKDDTFLCRNSVLWFDRSDRDSAIYSKVQLVPFSEYVPFRNDWPGFYKLLRKFVPSVMSQLEPGRQFSRFTIQKGQQSWSMATPICYEGTFDRVCRRMVYGDDGKKKAQILANISNDGWFYWQWADHASTENALHMSHYVFRAIENRVPVVRSVNTGISCSIDSNGRILAMVGQQAGLGRYRGTSMAVGNLLLDGKANIAKEGGPASPITHGPVIMTDSRESIYGRVADIFAWAISLIAAALAGIMIFVRPKENA